jgi:hypothetical protein
MGKVNDFFDILFNYSPGYIFGLLTSVIGFLGFVIAIALSPGYVMWERSISVLGHQAGGIFSRMGLIISNVLAIPFIVYVGRSLKDENINENLRKVAVGVAIFSSVIAALSGIITGSVQIIKDIHGFFALLSWIGGLLVCSLFGLLMRKSKKYSKSSERFSFIVAIIFGSYLIPFFITNFCSAVPQLCEDFGRKIYTIMPTYEWVVMFSILAWYFFNSIYILRKKIE